MRKLLALILLGALTLPAFAMTTYTVTKGDSLWRIAKKHRPASVSLNSMIKAVQAMNPDIFMDGNTALSVGEKLQLPSNKQEVAKALGTAPAQSAPASKPAATTNTAQSSSTPPFKEHPHMSELEKLKSKVGELQQIATMAQRSVTTLQTKVSQQTEQLKQKDTRIAELTSQIEKGVASGGFPWAWLWFVLLIIALGVFWYQRRRQGHAGGRGQAASRFGINPGKPMSSKDYATLNDNVQRYEVEKGKVAKPRFDAADPKDLIAQVDVAIRQGDFTAAEKQLKHAVWENKEDIPLRMKLLQLYTHMGNKREFNKVSEYLLKHLVSEDSPEWAEVRKMYLNTWVYDK